MVSYGNLMKRICAQFRRSVSLNSKYAHRSVIDDASYALAEGRHDDAVVLYEIWCEKVPTDLSGAIRFRDLFIGTGAHRGVC